MRKSVNVPTGTKPWIAARERPQLSRESASRENASRQQGLKRSIVDALSSSTPKPVPLHNLDRCDKIKIQGLEIAFPFKPYPCQVSYMSQVVSALYKGTNALLESPTGTGKTLCLLSVLLAWQFAIVQGKIPNPKAVLFKTYSTSAAKKGTRVDDITAAFDEIDKAIYKENQQVNSAPAPPHSGKRVTIDHIPRIFYTSRTHSQLNQVMAELRKTPYFQLAHTRMLQEPTKDEEIEDLFKIRSVCLASRDHYCIHPEAQSNNALRGTNLNSWCKKQTAKKLCHWHSGCDSTLKQKDLFASDAYDIEDLRKIGASGHVSEDPAWYNIHQPQHAPRPFCPFYAAREVQKKCSIIFLPYTYLVTPSMRKRLQLDISKDIVIIDEAHNLESVAEEATSFELTTQDVQAVLEAIQQVDTGILRSATAGDSKTEGDKLDGTDITKLLQIAQSFEKLLALMSQVTLRPSSVNSEEKVATISLEDFHNQISSIGLGGSDQTSRSSAMHKLSLALEARACDDEGTAELESNYLLHLATRVSHCFSAFEIVWNPSVRESSKKFRVIVSCNKAAETTGTSNKIQQKRLSAAGGGAGPPPPVIGPKLTEPRKLSFWSFAAHVALMDFFGADSEMPSGCHSMIVTSGTLKPLDALAVQLGSSIVEFPVQFENCHVIEDKQLFTSVVSTGPQGMKLTLNYESLKANPGMINDVGLVIADSCKLIKRDGVLVFFPSYSQMHRFVEQWKRGPIFSTISSYKEIFIEPSDAQLASSLLEDFKFVIDREHGRTRKRRKSLQSSKIGAGTSGAVFFGVFRGRLSEGLSLSDELCRLVVVIGVPYPAVGDLRISMKKQIFNACPLSSKATVIDGQTWYARQASQAVNQAAGRVIRHRDDHGAVLFVDSRYSSNERMNELSGWLVKNVKYRGLDKNPSWENVYRGLTQFFQDNGSIATAAKLPTAPSVVAPLLRAPPKAPTLPSGALLKERTSGSSPNFPNAAAASNAEKSPQGLLKFFKSKRSNPPAAIESSSIASILESRVKNRTAVPTGRFAMMAQRASPVPLWMGMTTPKSTTVQTTDSDICEICCDNLVNGNTKCCGIGICRDCCERTQKREGGGNCGFCRRPGCEIE